MMRRLSSMGQAYYLAMAELDHDLGSYLEALSVFDSPDARGLAAGLDPLPENFAPGDRDGGLIFFDKKIHFPIIF